MPTKNEKQERVCGIFGAAGLLFGNLLLWIRPLEI